MGENIIKSRMVDILVANSRHFFILSKDNKKIPILGYEKIIINFDDRIEYINGARNVIRNPLITYYVKLSAQAKLQLNQTFSDSDSDADLTIHSRGVKIIIGTEGYVFQSVITLIPSSLSGSHTFFNRSNNGGTNSGDYQSIKIDIDLRTIGELKDIFNEIDESVTSRFEILDI